MPARVHLRLRFQNLGKPRTAGLCGRAAGACDCGPLSCAKIERPSPLEKPSCKVRLFAQDRSREYRQKVTATTLFQIAFHPDFQLLAQTAHVRFRERKRVHTRLSEKDRTQRLTRRNRGPSRPRPQRGLVPPAQFLLFHHAFIYIHFPVLCEPPLSAERKIRRNCRHKFYPQPFLIAFFNFLHKRPTFAFAGKSGYTLGLRRKIAHNGLHAETGAFRTGVVSLPSDRSARFGNPAWPGGRTANFAAFEPWLGALSKNTESLRNSDALMRVAVPRRRGPAGLRDLYLHVDCSAGRLCCKLSGAVVR